MTLAITSLTWPESALLMFIASLAYSAWKAHVDRRIASERVESLRRQATERVRVQ